MTKFVLPGLVEHWVERAAITADKKPETAVAKVICMEFKTACALLKAHSYHLA